MSFAPSRSNRNLRDEMEHMVWKVIIIRLTWYRFDAAWIGDADEVL